MTIFILVDMSKQVLNMKILFR